MISFYIVMTKKVNMQMILFELQRFFFFFLYPVDF